MKKEITIDGAVYVLKETEEIKEESKEPKAYIPEDKGNHCYINLFGEMDSLTVEGDYEDKQYFILGNYGKTEQDLEGYTNYIDYLYQVKKYILENHLFIPDWNDINQNKYYIHKDYSDNNIDYDYSGAWKRLMILPYLSSFEACKDVIEKFDKELHYIFDYNNIRLN